MKIILEIKQINKFSMDQYILYSIYNGNLNVNFNMYRFEHAPYKCEKMGYNFYFDIENHFICCHGSFTLSIGPPEYYRQNKSVINLIEKSNLFDYRIEEVSEEYRFTFGIYNVFSNPRGEAIDLTQKSYL